MGTPLSPPADQPDAVGDLWLLHGPDALRLATVLVGRHEAHDVTTEAFLRVVDRAERGEVESFGRYLLRAVRNEATDRQRASDRRRRRDLIAVPPPNVVDPSPDVDLRGAFARLSVRQRTVVFLAYWRDMTEAEIADELGVSRGTVHRDLQRARARLRQVIT